MPGTSLFPSRVDSFPNIAATTLENDAGFEHDIVHNNEAAAISAVQSYLRDIVAPMVFLAQSKIAGNALAIAAAQDDITGAQLRLDARLDALASRVAILQAAPSTGGGSAFDPTQLLSLESQIFVLQSQVTLLRQSAQDAAQVHFVSVSFGD